MRAFRRDELTSAERHDHEISTGAAWASAPARFAGMHAVPMPRCPSPIRSCPTASPSAGSAARTWPAGHPHAAPSAFHASPPSGQASPSAIDAPPASAHALDGAQRRVQHGHGILARRRWTATRPSAVSAPPSRPIPRAHHPSAAAAAIAKPASRPSIVPARAARAVRRASVRASAPSWCSMGCGKRRVPLLSFMAAAGDVRGGGARRRTKVKAQV